MMMTAKRISWCSNVSDDDLLRAYLDEWAKKRPDQARQMAANWGVEWKPKNCADGCVSAGDL